MIETLNDPQRQAVTTTDGHVLVLAGAGSGKTKVLTTRIAWLIQNRLASPLAILAVTFTNKAAKEMQSRVGALLPINTQSMWVGTFHGLCHRLLRAHARDAGLPQTFQIIDTTDQLALVKRLLKAHGIDDEKFAPRDVQRFINRCKEEGSRAATIEADDPYTRRLLEIYSLYEQQCQREGVVDFPELMLRTLELLKANQAVREHYQRRFRYILIDEFQDTNPLQYEWLRLLAGSGALMFAVGDDDQSIYAFRGANIGNMADFERDYAQGNVIRLEQNYRSHGHILDAANSLISHNTSRLGKTLWTEAGQGELVRLCEQPSDHAEAQWVIDEIRALQKEGFKREDIAILYRSNAQSRVIEHALFTAAIPYQVYGGLRFFERQEIKHALAYVRLIARIDDDSSFLRVANFPPRGIGARSMEALTDQARQAQCSLAEAANALSGKAGSSVGQFVALVKKMQDETSNLPLSEAVDHVIELSGLRTHYKLQRDGSERVENLDELITAAKVFELEENLAGIASRQQRELMGEENQERGSALDLFLSHAALESGDTQAQSGERAVQLMTIHAAKGLEFDAVFLTGLEDGLFPHENSMLEPSGLQEERRLMYVAMTRARQRLYLTFAQSRMLHGQTRYCSPSRFVRELPESNIKNLSPKTAMDDWIGASAAQSYAYRAADRPAASTASGIIVAGQTFRVGQGVAHPRFGEGTILSLSGAGLDAQAQVHFHAVGTKTLALGVAKLEIIAR
jgi:DNA helicase II / ATP-dependent DNA helicase PcrA